MKTDLINIFNRLTSSELADYNLFDDILENHYEKFKYFYTLIEDIDIDNIEQIGCKESKNSLRVIIEPKNTSTINNIIFTINNNRENYAYSKHFKLNIVESGNYIMVEISVKNSKKEGDIYASRFI